MLLIENCNRLLAHVADILTLNFLAYFTVGIVFVYAALMTPVPSVCAVYDGNTRMLERIENTWNGMVCKEQSRALYFGYRLVLLLTRVMIINTYVFH